MAQQEITLELAEQVLQAQPFSVFVGAQVVRRADSTRPSDQTEPNADRRSSGRLLGQRV
jgi:hypothetical protein